MARPIPVNHSVQGWLRAKQMLTSTPRQPRPCEAVIFTVERWRAPSLRKEDWEPLLGTD